MLVAAAGLIVAAWGTLKTAQLADTQLTQAVEQKEDSERAQIEQISFWGKGPTVMVANRSLDPAHLWLKIREPAEGVRSIPFGVLPPCTRLEIPLSNKNATLDVVALQVLDVKGNGWERSYDGSITSSSALPAFNPRANRMYWSDIKDVPLEECGSR